MQFDAKHNKSWGRNTILTLREKNIMKRMCWYYCCRCCCCWCCCKKNCQIIFAEQRYTCNWQSKSTLLHPSLAKTQTLTHTLTHTLVWGGFLLREGTPPMWGYPPQSTEFFASFFLIFIGYVVTSFTCYLQESDVWNEKMT